MPAPPSRGLAVAALLILGSCGATPVERMREQDPVALGRFPAARDAVAACIIDEATQQGRITASHADGQSDRLRITISELRPSQGHSTRLHPRMDVLVAPLGPTESEVTLRLAATLFPDRPAVEEVRAGLAECLGQPRTVR